jgi:hypothetical protein
MSVGCVSPLTCVGPSIRPERPQKQNQIISKTQTVQVILIGRCSGQS